MVSRLVLTRHDAASATVLRARLVEVYRDGSTPAELADPFLSPAAFDKRLDGHLARSGFRLVVAEVDDEIAGFLYGYRLPPNTQWFNGLTPALDAYHAHAVASGDMVTINELMVRPRRRRQGVAAALHDDYVADRAERHVTLLVEPANVAANAAYRHWGYHKLGTLAHDPHHPFDALARQLRPPTTATG